MEDGVEAERPETRRPGDQLGGCSKNCGNRGESGGGGGVGGGGRGPTGRRDGQRVGKSVQAAFCVYGGGSLRSFQFGVIFHTVFDQYNSCICYKNEDK